MIVRTTIAVPHVPFAEWRNTCSVHSQYPWRTSYQHQHRNSNSLLSGESRPWAIRKASNQTCLGKSILARCQTTARLPDISCKRLDTLHGGWFLCK